MARNGLDRDLGKFFADTQQRRRIAETLGPAPRDALSALVGYGLNDRDIARYHRLPLDMVTELRDLWGITPDD